MSTLFAGSALELKAVTVTTDTAAVTSGASGLIITHTHNSTGSHGTETLLLTNVDLVIGDVVIAQVINYDGAGNPMVCHTRVIDGGSGEVVLEITYSNASATAVNANIVIAAFAFGQPA